MKIKRGRPKKVKTDDEVAKTPQSKEGSVGINRIYKFKDGTSCLVTYGTSKKKPEIVNL